MPGPLDGVRVVDFTTMIAGPYGTMILADQGADVIKVEAPLRSDHVRRAGYGQRHFSAAFVNNNRNKRSITVDAKSPAGREVMLDLARTADVFVQNFRPGVMTRLGLDYDDLKAVNPGVHLRIHERLGRNRPVRAQTRLRPRSSRPCPASPAYRPDPMQDARA